MSKAQPLSRGACAAPLLLLVFAGLMASACAASGGDGTPDGRGPDTVAPDARPFCYGGGGTPTPGAEVELRTFRNGIGLGPVNQDDALAVYAGPQGGHHFYMHARIRGMSPGNRDQPPETNPATWFSVYLEDGTVLSIVPCAYPLTYETDEDGEYALPYAPIVQINSLRVPAIFGQRVRIKVEVMDGEGRYATDEVWIVAYNGDAPDAGVPEPAPDAGAPDAGAPDAAAPDAAVLAD